MLRRMLLALAPLALLSGLMASDSVAQTPGVAPVASPVDALSGWRVSDIRRIDVDGTPLSMSPDGQWLAGTDMVREAVCIWDVQTLTPTCMGDDLQVSPVTMSNGFAWAPDSSALAFLDDIVQLGESNAVMLFDITSGSLTTLARTDGGPGRPSGTPGLHGPTIARS